MRGYIVYPTYRIKEGKAQVMLFGRLENGESFVTINDFRPYFSIRESDKEKAEQILNAMKAKDIEISSSSLTNFYSEKLCKVTLTIPREVPELRKIFIDKGIPCYEADIRFAVRFLIDKGIMIGLKISGEYSKENDFFVDRVYKNPKLEPAEFWPKLQVLSFDIETDMEGKSLFSISMYSDKISKVYLVADNGNYKNAEVFNTEKELLEKFIGKVRELDPDVLIGWNCIDFDLVFIRDKCRKYNIPFLLGRTNQECTLKITDSFFTDSSANFPGRAVIDGIHLMKVSFLRMEDYKLNTAAKTILGEEKLLTSDDRHKEIGELYINDKQKLVDYNLKDSILVKNLVEKSKILDLSIRRSMLTGMQLDRVNASIASFDSLYLRELTKRGLAAPSAIINEAEERIKGGFVMESKPGIYTGITVLDFKSLYPSIIRTFNIDPYSYVPSERYEKLRTSDKEGLIESPNKAHFRNDDGILPILLERLWNQRDLAKKEKDELTSQAIKILMNSFFGILANPTCRFYSLEMANAITHFGQFLIKLTAEKIGENGYEVIYSDTDSLFVNVGKDDGKECERIGIELQDYVNAFYGAYIKKHYNRKSYLELEFEKSFRKFLMPRIRGSEKGAKKRYAGLLFGETKISVVGLELVRRDWTELAKRFQYGLLEHIFHGNPVEKYISDFVNNLREGKMDSSLVYKKAIRKGVAQYTKTTPPHIKAARKLGKKDPGIIEYVITSNGPEPIEKTHSKLDYEHYIDKQLKPIADSVLSFQDKSFEEMIVKQKQTSLDKF
ncbi:DNA polymerase II [Candidatus Woesearchaeota archaeon]|nr:DNA polymerase II [Candidatus Woesearchaeota archaeon]